jgi:hypothetical protein
MEAHNTIIYPVCLYVFSTKNCQKLHIFLAGELNNNELTTLAYTRLYNTIQCYTRLYNTIKGYTRLYGTTQRYTSLYDTIQEYTTLYDTTQ